MRNSRGALRDSLGFAAASMLLIAGCGSEDGRADDRVEDTGDEAVEVDAVVHVSETDTDDFLPDADLAELAAASDRVVHGEVSEVERGVELVDADSLYSRATVEVREDLAGEAGDAVDVWFLTHLLGPHETVELVPTPEVGDVGVWLLTDLDPAFEEDGYVRTNQQGWLAVDSGDSTVRPVTERTPLGQEVARLESVDAVLSHLRSVRE